MANSAHASHRIVLLEHCLKSTDLTTEDSSFYAEMSRSAFNSDGLSNSYILKQIKDIFVFHADAAVGGGSTDLLLFVGAVDVDIALMCVDLAATILAGFTACQP